MKLPEILRPASQVWSPPQRRTLPRIGRRDKRATTLLAGRCCLSERSQRLRFRNLFDTISKLSLVSRDLTSMTAATYHSEVGPFPPCTPDCSIDQRRARQTADSTTGGVDHVPGARRVSLGDHWFRNCPSIPSASSPRSPGMWSCAFDLLKLPRASFRQLLEQVSEGRTCSMHSSSATLGLYRCLSSRLDRLASSVPGRRFLERLPWLSVTPEHYFHG